MGNIPPIQALMWTKFLRGLVGRSDFTCCICLTTMSWKARFKAKGCSHPYCATCISQFIDISLRDNFENSAIKCPSPGCRNILNPLACRQIITAETFVRWCDSLCKTTVARKTDAVYCPVKSCSELVVNECSKFARKAKCPRCKGDFCLRCKTVWHIGYLCDNNGIRREVEDVLFDQFVMKRGWRRCPNCKRCVELTSGCNIISCRCGSRFCFVCGGTKINFSHYTGACKKLGAEFKNWAG